MSKKTWGDWENLGDSPKEGGMGRVFKVKNTKTNTTGALKLLINSKRFQRFKTEAETINKLDHPHIIKLIDSSLEKEPFYAVYEFEEGGSLGDLSMNELLLIPLDQRLHLCEQICSGLDAVHKKLFVHRDIKPDNILISKDRKTVRLCDFGLVFVDESERKTLTYEQVGSRYYMPPEFENGITEEVSLKSDLYCVGKVLYYLVTGGKFSREIHRNAEYDLATILNNPYFEAISKILDKTITSEPEDRLDSAKIMEEKINEARKLISEQRPIEGVQETYRCLFCKVGVYKEICNSSPSGNVVKEGYMEINFGNVIFVFLECENCGNCQKFKLKYHGDRWFPDWIAK